MLSLIMVIEKSVAQSVYKAHVLGAQNYRVTLKIVPANLVTMTQTHSQLCTIPLLG